MYEFRYEPKYELKPKYELNTNFWYELKPKYDKKAKLCYMDTHTFIVHVETNDIYKDIAEDVKTRIALQIMS